MRVLFVDDDVRVLEAIERMLLEIEDDWDLQFASNTERALAELGRAPCDVIVSDLRMAGLDGAALLARVAELYPRTVRIVLSGHSDEETALKMVPVAHQFLAKPCPAATLHHLIARTAQLSAFLPERKLQTLVGQVSCLPSPPGLKAEVGRLLDGVGDSANATAELSRVIEQDPAMTAKVLQVAASAFFANPASVVDVSTAVLRLGLRTLRALAPSLSEGLPAHPWRFPTIGMVEELQQRSLAIARVAARMARLPEDATNACVAGLLCDVGELVLISAAPERLYVTESEAALRGGATHAAERATWGVTHAEIGAYLLGLWGLPFQIVQAVAHHHSPPPVGDRFELTQLVWLASCIVRGERPEAEILHRVGAEELYRSELRAYAAETSATQPTSFTLH